jgi:hypothetical protein
MLSRKMLMGLGVVAVAMMGVEGGCGDSNLFEGFQNSDDPAVRLENARLSIDASDYAEAIALLEALCGTDPAAPTCDDPTAALLASAHMGLTGLNAFDLLANADNLDPADLTAFYDVLAGMVDPTVLASLADAITLLEGITRTADEDLLLAMASAAHLVGSVLLAADPDGDGVYVAFVVDATLTATVESDMNRLIATANAVESVTGVLTITDELQAFQDSIEDADVGTPRDGRIDMPELQAFVNTVYP